MMDTDLVVRAASALEPPSSRWLGTAAGLAVPIRDDVHDWPTELMVAKDALDEHRFNAADAILASLTTWVTARPALRKVLMDGYTPSLGADFARRARAALAEATDRHRFLNATPRNVEVMVRAAQRLLEATSSALEEWSTQTSESPGAMNVYFTLAEGKRRSSVQFRITYGDGSIDLGG